MVSVSRKSQRGVNRLDFEERIVRGKRETNRSLPFERIRTSPRLKRTEGKQ